MHHEGPDEHDADLLHTDTFRTCECTECGTLMYEDVPQCPTCRAWVSTTQRRQTWWWQAIVMLLVAVLVLTFALI